MLCYRSKIPCMNKIASKVKITGKNWCQTPREDLRNQNHHEKYNIPRKISWLKYVFVRLIICFVFPVKITTYLTNETSRSQLFLWKLSSSQPVLPGNGRSHFHKIEWKQFLYPDIHRLGLKIFELFVHLIFIMIMLMI